MVDIMVATQLLLRIVNVVAAGRLHVLVVGWFMYVSRSVRVDVLLGRACG